MSEDRGPELARFTASPRDLTMFALVRGISGVAALLGSLLMLLGRLPIPLFLVALLGLAMSAAWLRQARKLWRQARTAKPAALVVYRSGYEVDRAFTPFDHVAAFEVDLERVDVKVTMTDGETRRIEPQYQGVDLDELVRTLQDALTATRSTK
ncbi:MAG TPA: hypothetical protein VI299_16745 [Polyangiales bacterium]